jgi:signal transduction histidine kinase
MTTVVERSVTMPLEHEALELEAIVDALRAISTEIGDVGLAQTLLKAALAHCGATRGAVLLCGGGEWLAKADASFPREKAEIVVSRPAVDAFRLPADLRDTVLTRQETVIRHDSWQESALFDPAAYPSGPDIEILCMPLLDQERTIGILYLESTREAKTFMPRCVSVLGMLASQAAVSFGSAQLFAALRETNMWMIKGQQLGRMGSYRWNTRTLLSRGSRECYNIIGLDLNVNPVPFQAFRDRIHPDDLPALERSLAEALSSRSPFRHEYRVVHEDGTTLHVVAVGEFDLGPSGDLELEGIIVDITGRKATEQALTDARAELTRVAGLASLGELAGSIIHEINQPLTGIIASAEACLRWLARDPAEPGEARKSALRVMEQGRRASSVVAGLKSLVRDTPLQWTDVQINEAVEEVLLLSKRELERAGIMLTTAFDPAIPEISADRVHLQQVVLNLVRNAIDAMAGVSGRTRVLTASSKLAVGHAAVTIADTGAGIDPATREHLFDALYTTKGEGLGLGLSICRKIIGAHGGRLWVEENPTHGATFTFTLPLRRSARLAGNN